MPSKLRVSGSTPTSWKYINNPSVDCFKGIGTGLDSSAFGGTATRFATTVPGTNIQGIELLGGDNATATLDIQSTPTIKKGRSGLYCYVPLPTLTTGDAAFFHNPVLDVRFGRNSSFVSPWHLRRIPLNLGWNHVVFNAGLSETYLAASDFPTLDMAEGAGGDVATLNASGGMWSQNVQLLRLRTFGIGGGRLNRVIFTEIIDDDDFVPQICLIFDDGYERVGSLAAPFLNALGIYFGVAVIGSLVGSGASFGYMDRAELVDLDKAGNDLLDHTWDHPTAVTAATYTQAQWDEQFDRNQGYVGDISTRRNAHKFHVSPQGGISYAACNTYRQAMYTKDVKFSFGTANRAAGANHRQRHFIPRVWVDVTTTFGGAAYNMDTLIAMIFQQLMAGASPVLMLHDIFDGVISSNLQISFDDLKKLARALKAWESAGFVQIVTPTEMMHGRAEDLVPSTVNV